MAMKRAELALRALLLVHLDFCQIPTRQEREQGSGRTQVPTPETLPIKIQEENR